MNPYVSTKFCKLLQEISYRYRCEYGDNTVQKYSGNFLESCGLEIFLCNDVRKAFIEVLLLTRFYKLKKTVSGLALVLHFLDERVDYQDLLDLREDIRTAFCAKGLTNVSRAGVYNIHGSKLWWGDV